MKIKRFLAKDMRSALAEVKEVLGSDAVIMSNKKVAGGIEIVAAVDYDEVEIPKPAAKSSTANQFDLTDESVSLSKQPRSNVKVSAATKASAAPADSLQALLERQQSKAQQHKQPHDTRHDMPDWAKGLQAKAESAQQPQASISEKAPISSRRRNSNVNRLDKNKHVDNAELDAMKDELASIRNILTHQMNSLMSEQKHRTNPVGAMLESQLLQAEFSPMISRKLSGLADDYSPADLVALLPRRLAEMLKHQGDDVIDKGGLVAFVGPTGVGKTTSVAKLAARFIAKHGADQLALITTDHYRIGAYEQLATYGKIMGCPVRQVDDFKELEQVLYQFRNRKLILIDTAGMGQRDLRLFKQLDNLTANITLPIRSYLVMSATGQRGVLEDAVKQFAHIPLSGAVLTKLDESVSLAPALSVLIQSGLPLSYVTDGQRVPEDMHLADPFSLAKEALSKLGDAEEAPLNNIEGPSNLAYAFE